MDPVRICEDLRDQAYAQREKFRLNSTDYTIYSHRADALNDAAQKIKAAQKLTEVTLGN